MTPGTSTRSTRASTSSCPVQAEMSTTFTGQGMIQNRLNLDGYTMLKHPERVSQHFFDPQLVLDGARPPLQPGGGAGASTPSSPRTRSGTPLHLQGDLPGVNPGKPSYAPLGARHRSAVGLLPHAVAADSLRHPFSLHEICPGMNPGKIVTRHSARGTEVPWGCCPMQSADLLFGDPFRIA